MEFNLSILSFVNGCVENNFAILAPEKGFMMNSDAVDWLPIRIGSFLELSSSFCNALAKCFGSPVNLADVSSAMNSLDLEIAN